MRGQALVEFAIITPLMLLIILGGTGVGLLLLHRMELTYAAQQAADWAVDSSDCDEALEQAALILGRTPSDGSCELVDDYAEVSLTQNSPVIVPLVPLPSSVTVTARSLILPEPSASP